MAKDTPAPRNRTQVRIVNLQMLTEQPSGRWMIQPQEFLSSADAIKAQPALGAGTYQVAHLFGEARTLKIVKQPPLLVVDDGEIGEPTAPEADDDD